MSRLVPPRQSKYRNTKTEYNGILYDSQKEAGIARDLLLRLRARDIIGVVRQVPLVLEVNGRKICKHIVDFKVIHPDGSEEFIEVKGYQTRDYKLKRKLLEALYPNIKYTVV